MDSLAAFVRLYRDICRRADFIFTEYDLCRWEKNEDGGASCFINRIKTKNNRGEYRESDGCCIDVCKEPRQFNDPQIKKKQHSKTAGCLVKSLKCKLHICNGLITRGEKDPEVKKHLEELDLLRKEFAGIYGDLWKKMPFGASLSSCIDEFKALV
ncbi:hypothetical protein AGMMS49928_30000 [Spirochaetia bacterium]|nr:hypothetical protein AGMMS49928_30000 [Spirochaetia bacterium]